MKFKFPLKILILTLLLPLLFIDNIYGQNGRVNINRSFPVVQAEKLVWLGSDYGLMNYSQADDAFKIH